MFHLSSKNLKKRGKERHSGDEGGPGGRNCGKILASSMPTKKIIKEKKMP